MKMALEEAAAWYARLQAPDCRLEERAQFRQWLDQHQDHARAYASVERVVRELDARASRDPNLLAMAKQALAMGGIVDTFPLPPRRTWRQQWRQRLLPVAAAASILVGLLTVLLLPDFLASRRQVTAFASEPGQQRALTLDDGTLTQLDIDSAVTVKMSAQARAVDLLKGRAIFEVAHDAQRPFSVAVGTSRIIALGTRFQVQRQDPLVIVTLEEGVVDVVGEFEGKTLRERLQPGEQLRFEQGSASWIKTAVETDTVTSWSRGRHVFRSMRLADALDEVNRYAAVKVRLGDPALADLAVSGNFIIGDSSVILSAFAAVLPVRVVDGGNELVVFPVYGPDAPSPDRVQ